MSDMENLMNSSYTQIGVVVALVAAVLYMLYTKFGQEGYEDTVSRKEIAREENIARDRYEYQDVSDTNIAVRSKQLDNLVDSATMMGENLVEEPTDLLPMDNAADDWARANPENSGTVHSQNFLEAGHHFGENTQMSSMRNVSYDLRSTPPIPKDPVSIWQNSTITPNVWERSFEIGQ